jgi:hypothetical protein
VKPLKDHQRHGAQDQSGVLKTFGVLSGASEALNTILVVQRRFTANSNEGIVVANIGSARYVAHIPSLMNFVSCFQRNIVFFSKFRN